MNEFTYKETYGESMASKHYMISNRVNHASPMMLMFLFNIALIIIQIVLKKQLRAWGFSLMQHDIIVDENLPYFFNAISYRQARMVIREYQYMKEKFGIEIQDPYTIDKLKSISKQPIKYIVGSPWYQITQNQEYANSFNYIAPYVEDREMLIEDGYQDQMVEHTFERLNSRTNTKNEYKKQMMTEKCKQRRFEQSDMVMVLLNLSCIPDTVMREMDFSKDWTNLLKELMEDYKKKWAEEHNREWEYQTEKIE